MNALVVPTNRPDRLDDFLTAWSPWPWDELIVVQDGPEVTFEPSAGRFGDRTIRTYSWKEIEAGLNEAWIISRMDSAIRCFGFWKAWQAGAEFILTLDDDCFPVAEGARAQQGFACRHIENLEATPAWQSTVPGLRVRGLPYVNTGKLRNVRVSVGLWVGHPDIDAVQSLAGPARGTDAVVERARATRVMSSDQYFPMSGMNLAFHRDVACLMYFPPMGLDSPYARFDDIWCGLVLQRICRHLRYAIVCGEPVVDHKRASDPFVNLVKEAPGIRANEHVWEAIDAVELRGADPLTCMGEMGEALRTGTEDAYIERWGRAIEAWCDLFREPQASAL